jgi:hypothetical protein
MAEGTPQACDYALKLLLIKALDDWLGFITRWALREALIVEKQGG